VTGGKQGLIEVAVARNAISHGIKKINQTMVSRFISSGCISPWQIGESVTLDYQKLDDYRARLKSLMRFSDNVKRRAK
jgi:hypothetical protein